MEEAQKNFIFGNLAEAVAGYTKLVDAKPTQPDPYLCRAITYIELANYDLALHDLEKANQLRPSHFQTLFRLGVTQFQKQLFTQAAESFKLAEGLATREHEKMTISGWVQKCAREVGTVSALALNATAVVAKVEETKAVSKPASEPLTTGKKVEYDWYQSSTHVYVTLKAKGLTKDKCKITFGDQDFSLDINLGEGKTYEYSYNLNAEIQPEHSGFEVLPMKIEVKLKKKVEGVQWTAVERTDELHEANRPSYPTSAKRKVDWDKLDHEITRETAKDKPEGDEALSGLFQAIYS